MKRVSLLLVLIMATVCLAGCNFKWNFEMVEAWFQNLLGKQAATEQEVTVSLDPIQTFNDSINKEGYGNEFVFKDLVPCEAEVAEAINETTVYLYLDEGIYYPIHIPDTFEYVTDCAKYIYARDNSVSVSVVSNVSIQDFSGDTFIENPIPVSQVLVVSDSKGDIQEAAIHVVNDKAIVIRACHNVDVYNTILDGLKVEHYRKSSINCITTNEDTEQLEELPVYTGYHMTVTAGLGDDIQKIYDFDDGSLTISRELRTFEQAVLTQSVKTAVIARSSFAGRLYTSEDIYYVEMDNYTLGVYNVNYNTSLTCFGYGQEARFNTIQFLKSQK